MAGTVKGFDDYLESLPSVVFQRLYQVPATTLAIFRRMLPNLAKVFVMTLLYNETAIALADLQAWVRPGSTRDREYAFEKLRKLHIFYETTKENKGTVVSLDPVFRKNFRLALTGGGNHHSFGVPVRTPDKKPVDIAFLDKYAAKQFDNILHFMVQTETSDAQPSPGVVQLLIKSGLMEKRGFGEPVITKNGFSFLLQEGNSQIWVLLIQYLDMCEGLGMNRTDVLHFLLMLGSLDLGTAYSSDPLTDTQKVMLNDLRDYGIIYFHRPKSNDGNPPPTTDRFYPTRLATTLTSDSSSARSIADSFSAAITANDPTATTKTPGDTGEKGFIILETNYRLYAYTSSPLQIAVLNLFCKLRTRFPNLVTGRLSRRSIQAAIKRGISADQIIEYLRVHAHPQMRKTNALVLPPTVVDQIRLWELEGERMKTSPGYLIREFVSEKDYEDTRKYAEELGVLKWASKEKRMVFVTRTEAIVEMWKRKNARSGAVQQGGGGGTPGPAGGRTPQPGGGTPQRVGTPSAGGEA